MSGEKRYKKLLVWQKAIELTDFIYSATKNFPNDEKFGLSNQLRRAAVSVASNIAEGATRQSKKEFLQFLTIAKASLAEIETQLIIAHRQEYITKKTLESGEELINEIDKMTYGLIESQKKELAA